MTRCRGGGLLTGALALGAALLSACGPQESRFPVFEGDERPNVLVVLVDVLRSDHLGAYGYPLPTSPNIDALAAEGFRFASSFSHSTWTKPSVATLFTSIYSDQHGLGSVGTQDAGGFRTEVLALELQTLAETFQAAGYRTAAFGTNVHIQRKTGFAQGFDFFFMRRLVNAFQLNERILAWVPDGPAGQPFFAYVHYMDVHWPYTRYLPDRGLRFGATKFPRKRPPETWTAVPRWAETFLDEEALAVLTARYDEEISYTDAAFGELLAALRESDVLDDTILVFVGDHGEGLNEHGELQHGFEPYPEVTMVPFIVRLPPAYGLAPGTSSEIVGLVDVMPTLLDLVGLETPPYLEGRSLEPILLGERLRERPVYVEGNGVRGLRSARHTLHVDEAGERSCFDRAADPMELAPLSENLPAACDQMAAALELLVRRFGSMTEPGVPPATVEFDDDEIQALRDLGYID